MRVIDLTNHGTGYLFDCCIKWHGGQIESLSLAYEKYDLKIWRLKGGK